MSEQTPAPEENVEWRRMHVITPVLNAWKVIVALFAVVLFQNIDTIAELRDSDVDWTLVLLFGGGGFLLLLLVLAGYSALSWRMMRYAVGRDAVFLHSGILFRQQRHARLNRIQAIDVVQPLLARLFGLAKLKIETAGGAGSSVDLAFLKEDTAHQLRREVLARAAGTYVESTTSGGSLPATGSATPGATEPAAPSPVLTDSPERELLTVPPGRLVASLLLSGSMITFLVVVLGLAVISIGIGSGAPMIGGLPALLGWGTVLWAQFSTGFGFRAAISADGVRLRHGLLEQRTQTVPPGRVHAVALEQPLLWRRRGWWRVRVNIAGYGETTESATGNVLLPVGPRGDALTALWLVLPDLGVTDPQTVIDGALEGTGESGGFTTSPRRARWLDPISWRRNGILLTDRATLIRRGRLSRSLAIVPHERSQSLAISQGPVQRQAVLASLTLALVSGPVAARAVHLDQMTALAKLGDQSEHSKASRQRESPEEWLRRVGLEPAHDATPAAPSGAPAAPAPPSGTPVSPGAPAGAPAAPAPPSGAPVSPGAPTGAPAAPAPPSGAPVVSPPSAAPAPDAPPPPPSAASAQHAPPPPSGRPMVTGDVVPPPPTAPAHPAPPPPTTSPSASPPPAPPASAPEEG
ncbi:PH domain-containing protein [Georgenia sp. MJ173]|uniref:PH domain-containing protein n=1 Tax=Georgenia sunbinii TaxID=3117728 RepID=UPI002F261A05